MKPPKSDAVPPDGDPSWVERCKPLLLHLREKPRTHKELVVWRREAKVSANMLIQMLAWCENRKLASYRGGQWWVGWHRATESPEEPEDA